MKTNSVTVLHRSIGISDLSHIIVSLVELPTERYIRKVNKSYLDLIISVGGMAGLFFGASFIRLIDYFFKFLKYQKTLYDFVFKYKRGIER